MRSIYKSANIDSQSAIPNASFVLYSVPDNPNMCYFITGNAYMSLLLFLLCRWPHFLFKCTIRHFQTAKTLDSNPKNTDKNNRRDKTHENA